MSRNWVLALMSACFASIALDNSKLVAALPTLARAAEASPTLQRWVVEASLLVYASSLLLGGALCERFGPRRLLLGGLLAFAATSLWGAFTSSLYGLIAARAATGAATACITPATLGTLKHYFDDTQRPRAIAIWTASFGVGAALGPVLAGLLVARGGMHAVLLANLPPIALCALGVQRLVSADLPRRVVPLDWPGTVLCLAAAGSVLFALLAAPTHGWLSREVLLGLLLSALLTAAAITWLRRARHPLFDVALFAESRFTRALLVIFFGYLAFSGSSFVSQQYLQLGQGKSAFEAGWLMLPLSLSLLCGTLLAPWLMKQTSDQSALYFSLSLALLGAGLLVWATLAASALGLALAMVPFALGLGSSFANATELTLGAVAPERAASAGAISESAFELGGVLGIAVLSSVLGVTPSSVAWRAPHAFAIAALGVAVALAAHSARVLRSVKPTPTRNAVSE